MGGIPRGDAERQENPTVANVGFVESYAVGPRGIQRVEDSRVAFTIFLQEGFRMKQGGIPPSRARARGDRDGDLRDRLSRDTRHPSRRRRRCSPTIVHLCLTPFMGALRPTSSSTRSSPRTETERLFARQRARPPAGRRQERQGRESRQAALKPEPVAAATSERRGKRGLRRRGHRRREERSVEARREGQVLDAAGRGRPELLRAHRLGTYRNARASSE